MIIKDTAKSRELGGKAPDQTCVIIFDELCSFGHEYVPNEKIVIRNTETKEIICLDCFNKIRAFKYS